MKTNLAIILLLTLVISSCFKDDEPVTPHVRGDVVTDTIALTQTYKNQVYYNLASATVGSSNLKTISDLAFDCSPTGTRVILNSACFMKAADLGLVPFGQDQDTTNALWVFDKSDGNPDSTALLNWFTIQGDDTLSNGHVYAVNTGMDELGNLRGYYQVIFDSLKNATFYFRYANLDGTGVTSGNVTKDPAVSFLYYSFDMQSEQPLEPAKSSWDLLFTQYTTMLYTDLGEPYPYLVTGVLLNRSDVRASLDTITPFENIDIQSAASLNYSSQMDFIGYEWKYYNFETGSYTVDYSKSYVIRTRDGFYFKLRFVGFYNSSGEKGYPVIEFQRL